MLCARSFNLDTLSLAGGDLACPNFAGAVGGPRRPSMPRINLVFLFVLAALIVTPLRAGAGQFKHAVYYKLGSRERPYQVITADFNHDGNLDLAVADWLSGHVSILLGKGDGTFQKTLRFSNPGPVAIAAGDFDEDGNTDLAVVEFGGTGYSVLALYMGEGDGRFRPGATYQLGIQTSFLALDDFNGDGHLDVATPDSGNGKNGSVMVFFGTGKGTLKKPARYFLHAEPSSIAAADLNGDKHADLAVLTAGNVVVLLNDGTGRFQKPATYSAGGGETLDVVIADLDHDEAPDLVVANNSQGMVVLLNKGDGTFGKPAIYLPCSNNCQAPSGVVVADFNLDGNPDVAAVADRNDSYLFYGKGNGKFGPAVPIKDTINFNGGESLAAGDFDHDGAPDLAIPIQLKGKVAVMLNSK